MSDFAGSHGWLLDPGGGTPRAMRGQRPRAERPSDAEIAAAAGAAVVARQPLSDRAERLRFADGRSAVLKVGGFWSPETERLLYRHVLDPSLDGSPALLAGRDRWLLLEDLGDRRVPLEACDPCFARLAETHAARAGAARGWPEEVRRALAAAPLTVLDEGAFARRVEALAGLVERAGRASDAWELGDAETAAVDRLRRWVERAAPALWTSGPTTLLHGDFQCGNWLAGPRAARPRLVDWELAGLGPGILDLYYLDPEGAGAAHAPAGAAAGRALAAYAERLSIGLLRDAVVWGALVGAVMRLADYFAEPPRSRTPPGELPGAAAALIRYAARYAAPGRPDGRVR
ncbi:MAG TPA: phosphotransferase [Chloroflexota bacterium]|nr:phosphotransferase [Chloroflexota bacterium]